MVARKEERTRTEHPIQHFSGLDDVTTLSDLQAWVANIVAAVPDAYRDDANVIASLGEYSHFDVFYERPETPLDRQNDERAKAEREAQQHAEEYAQFERLRAKYEKR